MQRSWGRSTLGMFDDQHADRHGMDDQVEEQEEMRSV